MSTLLSVNGNEVDLASDPSTDSSKTNYIILQGNRPLKGADKRLLVDAGAIIQEYLGNEAYLCKYEPHDLQPVKEFGFVSDASVYAPDAKSTAALKTAFAEGNTKTQTIDILLHKDSEPPREIIEAIAALDGADENTLSSEHRRIRVTVNEDALKKIQDIDGVMAIEEATPQVLFNNLARVDLKAGTPVNGNTYQGNGQIVSVADTGFDLGSTTDVHPAFRDRVIAVLPFSGSSANDPHGHGTHCAGSILGDGDSDSMGGKIQGTAPKAKLVFQSLLDKESSYKFSTPNNPFQLFNKPNTDYGAKIHSNSWGQGWDARSTLNQQRGYDVSASGIDSFIWQNPDSVVIFAAGNNGSMPNKGNAQIGSSATAKNCITVGATDSARPSEKFKFNPDKKTPNDATKIAAFSSTGPTPEGRLKPDIVAPGVAILSTCSRDKALPAKVRSDYGPSKDPLWTFNSGTSMATPLFAGCVASVREALVASGQASPSAACVKAIFLNTATLLGTTTAEKEAPSYVTGFGKVSVEKALTVVVAGKGTVSGIIDNKVGLVEDQSIVEEVKIPKFDKAVGIKVTLAYTDRPAPVLQNALSLTVTSNGQAKRGDDGILSENNVQQVVLKELGDTVKIDVTAERIGLPDDKQPYALVWSVFEL